MAYSNTFTAPFVFDDNIFVRSLEFRTQIQTAWEELPATARISEMPWASRPFLYATFALNHTIDSFHSWGYHVVNIAFHLGNGILLYFLVIMTGRHIGHEEKDAVPVALLSSLIFVLHPVQTEAVTMVVNRSMLMATAFFLLGLIFFLKAVTSEGKEKYYYTGGLFLAALLGSASREDFATFPLILIAYDLFFISRFRPRAVAAHYKAYIAAFLGTALLGYLVLNNTYDKYEKFSEISIPPIQYALTQFKVHWTYIRLLLLPVNQNIDYDYPVAETLFELPTMLAFLGYGGLWALGLLLARRRPEVSFGIIWFLVILLPISFAVALLGNLKLDDPIFEHRLYLPAIGIIVLASLALVRFAQKRRAFVPLVVALCIVLGGAAYARNATWAVAVNLWTDVIKKSPNKSRGYNNLALHYAHEGRPDKAIEYLEAAIRIEPDNVVYNLNMGAAYLVQGLADQAIEHLEAALKLAPNMPLVHTNLGVAYAVKEDNQKALEQFLESYRRSPVDPLLLKYIAGTYQALGQREEAIKYYISSLWLNKSQTEVLENLSVLFMETGQKERAVKHLEPLVKLNPGNPSARILLGRLYLELGKPFDAIKQLEAARKLRPDDSEIDQALTKAYKAANDMQWPNGKPRTGLNTGNR